MSGGTASYLASRLATSALIILGAMLLLFALSPTMSPGRTTRQPAGPKWRQAAASHSAFSPP
jgi:hypothetical protein